MTEFIFIFNNFFYIFTQYCLKLNSKKIKIYMTKIYSEVTHDFENVIVKIVKNKEKKKEKCDYFVIR